MKYFSAFVRPGQAGMLRSSFGCGRICLDESNQIYGVCTPDCVTLVGS